MAGEFKVRTKQVIQLLGMVLAFALFAISSPAIAHKKHKEPAPVENIAGASAAPQTTAAGGSPATHSGMSDDMDAAEDRSSLSFPERLVDWLGRLHPVIVHFPIAFFPAALFVAIVGRRRAVFAASTRFLIVAGGVIAPVAAVLGWLDAMNADPDSLLTVHRWLGTAIGASGLGLALWALRRPGGIRGPGMVAGLSIITAAIVVQGWFGGAMVHGINHLNW